ncbi:hypothetical protein AB833_01220 [Chromatiales bacterium (ex Bugula neritina AB1)]|nr:hypothetical protein AB833_01220 [Chromatiales bacterium (ex Bugula neritina AB1)]
MNLHGSCLCGEIEFEVKTPIYFNHCYCGRCRKASGSGRASVLVTRPEHLRWTKGEALLKRWDLPSASSFATSFCSQCGCAQPRLTRAGDFAVIPAGSLDDALPIKPECHEHFASRAEWIVLDESNLAIHDHDA